MYIPNMCLYSKYTNFINIKQILLGSGNACYTIFISFKWRNMQTFEFCLQLALGWQIFFSISPRLADYFLRDGIPVCCL